MTGILVIDKPRGITSFGVLIKLKKIIHQKKVGHTGTLDPMATGVLTVMLGGATRFCELLPVHDKAYTAVLRLGVTTDTLDITGKVLSESEVNVTKEQFEKALGAFRGEIMQVPPMYSAVSVNGQRLYQAARKGEEIEREARPVTVYSLEMIGCNESENEYTLNIHCSAGTYVRSLADDIGKALGCGAVLTELRRTQANGFSIDNALTLEQLQTAADEGRLEELLISVDEAMKSYPEISVTAAQSKRFSNGGELSLDRLSFTPKNGVYRVYGPAHAFLGLGEARDEALWVKKLYVE